MALAPRPVNESYYGMPGSPQGNSRMVLPGQCLQAMEVYRFTLVDPWETCVLTFCLSRARLRASHLTAGSGKSVLWFVIPAPFLSNRN